mmetsp:Transcript_36/g.93  ORF Transcript_36/g.93 Transcript_36/m.93 type:complete len:232 (+) Transcript_36:625-1320(+)
MLRMEKSRSNSRTFKKWPSVSSLRFRTTTITRTTVVSRYSTSWDPTAPTMAPPSAWVSSPMTHVPSSPMTTTVPPPTPPSITASPCPTPTPLWSEQSACPVRRPKTTKTKMMPTTPITSRRVANNSTKDLPSVRLVSPVSSSTPIPADVTSCRGSRSFVRMEIPTRLDLPRIGLPPSLLPCLVLPLFFWLDIRITSRPSWSVPRLTFLSKLFSLGRRGGYLSLYHFTFSRF